MQLVDPETLALAPGVEKLLGPDGLKTELFSCLIETNTPVCESAEEARAELVRLRRQVREAAARRGTRGRRRQGRTRSRGRRSRRSCASRATCRCSRSSGRSSTPARLRPARPRRHGELRRVPADARGDRALAAGRARALAQLAVPPGCGDRRALVSRGPAAASCRAAHSRPRSPRRRTGRPTSRRPARTTRAAGGTPARTRGSARSRCGSPTSRRTSTARRRSPR